MFSVNVAIELVTNILRGYIELVFDGTNAATVCNFAEKQIKVLDELFAKIK